MSVLTVKERVVLAIAAPKRTATSGETSSSKGLDITTPAAADLCINARCLLLA